MNQASKEGKDISATAVEYGKTAEEARKHIKTEIFQGRYQENGAQPTPNPYLEKIDAANLAAKDVPYSAQVGLIEMGGEMVQRQESLAQIKENLERREAMISARRDNIQQRREQVKQAYAKSNNPELARNVQERQGLNSRQMSFDAQQMKQMRENKTK